MNTDSIITFSRSFCLNLDTNFYFFIIIEFSINPPQKPTSGPPRPRFGSRPEFGNHFLKGTGRIRRGVGGEGNWWSLENCRVLKDPSVWWPTVTLVKNGWLEARQNFGKRINGYDDKVEWFEYAAGQRCWAATVFVGENKRSGEKICPDATLYTTNSTRTCCPAPRGEWRRE
jgi:hypothetical protein